MEPDFSGYVSKANLKCADGRTIMPGAFAHQDGMKVPLVYQHNHQDVMQVLGHAILSKKEDGVWGDMYLNDTTTGNHTKQLVKNKDLDKLSVWAQGLDERGYMVHDGFIKEVSLVLSGANPGARVENVLMHSDLDDLDNMFVVTGDIIIHSDIEEKPKEEPQPVEKPAEESTEDKTVEEVLATLSEDQQTAVNAVIDGIVTEAVTEALAEKPEAEITHDNMDSTQKGTPMNRSPFKNNSGTATAQPELKHSDVVSVLTHAKGGTTLQDFNADRAIGSLRQFVRSEKGREMFHSDLMHSDYGIENIDVLFPDAQALMSRPTFVDRRQEWVKVFLAGTSHSPFSRVKTIYADITADEARAKGYIKAHEKTEEVFPVFKRETGPAWIIKKQKLDRQDIIDIVDFDVVAWMKVEMRGKLDEELARAALFGDGRPALLPDGTTNPDKIPDPGASANSGNGIRAIVSDADLYVTTYDVPLAANATGDAWNVLLDKSVESDEDYLGSGDKTAFMAYKTASRLLTIRDTYGHRIYRNLSEVAGDMGVARIVKVPTVLFPTDVLAVVLDLKDYNFGTNRGGEVTLFDDFDIDFNQYKYLIETYLSGALTLPYSAQVYKRVDPTDTLVVPAKPLVADNVVTIPTVTGVTYYRMDTPGGTAVANGATITLTEDTLPFIEIEARPSSDAYYFGDNSDMRDTWLFEYEA